MGGVEDGCCKDLPASNISLFFCLRLLPEAELHGLHKLVTTDAA